MSWFWGLSAIAATILTVAVLVAVGLVWVWVEARRDEQRTAWWVASYQAGLRLRQLETFSSSAVGVGDSSPKGRCQVELSAGLPNTPTPTAVTPESGAL